jgi:ComF family protein
MMESVHGRWLWASTMAEKILTTALRGANWVRGVLPTGGTALLRLLFPQGCICCDMMLDEGHSGPLFCDRCRGALSPEEWVGCVKCGAHVRREAQTEPGCPQCRGRRLQFDAVFPLGAYDRELRAAVLRMKHRSGDTLASEMGKLYIQQRGLQLQQTRIDVVVPVPMHWLRHMSRGTNSPDILATRIARHLGRPVEHSLLVRTRKTLPQADLPPSRRFENVRGAFRLAPGYDIRGTRVLLVDDIVTTGATCSEAAKVLKQAGAAMVAVAVIARTADRREA